MKRLGISAVLSIAMAFLASGCLWGVVTDVETGAPISGATVSYTDSQGHTDSTTTNAGGLYAFDAATGPVPAAGPASFELNRPGCQALTAARQVEYNDNPNAGLDNPSSFWEIQNFGLQCGSQPPSSTPTPCDGPCPNVTLSIDADITNGTRPCSPVDSTATVSTGTQHQVGLCVENQPAAPDAFDLTVLYDAGLNSALEVADVGLALDDNPDANDGGGGATQLGTGWSCTGFGFAFPTGDGPAGGGDARIVCNADIFSPSRTLTASPGLLATITFDVIGVGVDTIRFANLSSVAGSPPFFQAVCGMEPTTCLSATITKR